MIKQFVTVLIFSSTFSVQAKHALHSFKEIQDALHQGNQVKAIYDISYCNAGNNRVANGSASINFDIFNYYPVVSNNTTRMVIATSVTMLTEHRTHGPIYGYLRFRIFEDNSIEIDNKFYDPVTFEQKEAIHYECTLNKGVDVFSLD